MQRTIGAALVLLAAGCGGLQLGRPLSQAAEDWRMLGGAAARQNSTSLRIAPPLTVEWEQDINAGAGPGSPITADSILLVGNLRGELLAIHARTGKKLGAVSLGDAITGSPVLVGSLVIAALHDPDVSLVGYDLTDGKARWQRAYGDMEATPLLYDGRLYAGTIFGWFLCIQPANGDTVWTFLLKENLALKGIRSSPAAASRTVVFGADDGAVYGMDIDRQRERWKHPTDAAVVATPAIADGAVYVGNLAGTIVALDLATGIRRWSFSAGSAVYAGALPLGARVIICTTGGSIIALDAASGKMEWRREVGSPMNAPPLATGEYLYVGTLRKELLSLKANDGTIVWRTTLPGRVKSAPAVAYERLYVATDDRTLVAFRGSNQ